MVVGAARFVCVGVLAVAAVAPLPVPGQAGRATGAKALVGIWKGYAVEGKGERADRGPLHLQITITAERIKAINLGDGNKDMGEGTYKIGAAKDLKHLDATGIVLPRKKSQTYEGIFDLQGDTLRWCVDNTRRGRPEEFRTGGGKYLLVLKRVTREE